MVEPERELGVSSGANGRGVRGGVDEKAQRKQQRRDGAALGDRFAVKTLDCFCFFPACGLVGWLRRESL
jgi:hypothetical protein